MLHIRRLHTHRLYIFDELYVCISGFRKWFQHVFSSLFSSRATCIQERYVLYNVCCLVRRMSYGETVPRKLNWIQRLRMAPLVPRRLLLLQTPTTAVPWSLGSGEVRGTEGPEANCSWCHPTIQYLISK